MNPETYEKVKPYLGHSGVSLYSGPLMPPTIEVLGEPARTERGADGKRRMVAPPRVDRYRSAEDFLAAQKRKRS